MDIGHYPTGWFDFHCHFCDIIEFDQADIAEEVLEAEKVGVVKFFSSAYNKEQFEWHLNYQQKNVNTAGSASCSTMQQITKTAGTASYSTNMEWYAGIHPMFVEETKGDIDLVAGLAQQGKIIAIGEIGFDSRYDNQKLQEKLLLTQLEMAKTYDLPVVFHSVGRYYDLYKLIKNNFPKTRGILHSFASSEEVVQIFKSLRFGFSLGASILLSKNHEKVLKNILDWGLIVIETDAPAQKPYFAETECNKLRYLPQIAEKLAEAGAVDTLSLRALTWKSLDELGFTGTMKTV